MYWFQDKDKLIWLDGRRTYEEMLGTYPLVYKRHGVVTTFHTPKDGWLVNPAPSKESVVGTSVVQAPKQCTREEFYELVASASVDPTREHALLEHLQEKYETRE